MTQLPLSPAEVRARIDETYRTESRRVFASLVRLVRDFDLAEEALHEAFAVAVERWGIEGVPDNPRAWLVSASRFKAVDALRRRGTFANLQTELASRLAEVAAANAARAGEERGGGVFSHPVGMAVHDDGPYAFGPLRPGHVFSVDPQLRVPEEKLYIRYEDVVVVTEDGAENFTDFLPSELANIEKLVGTGGVVQKVPPVPENQLKRPNRLACAAVVGCSDG
jgi:hypothetical protein